MLPNGILAIGNEGHSLCNPNENRMASSWISLKRGCLCGEGSEKAAARHPFGRSACIDIFDNRDRFLQFLLQQGKRNRSGGLHAQDLPVHHSAIDCFNTDFLAEKCSRWPHDHAVPAFSGGLWRDMLLMVLFRLVGVRGFEPPTPASRK